MADMIWTNELTVARTSERCILGMGCTYEMVLRDDSGGSLNVTVESGEPLGKAGEKLRVIMVPIEDGGE